MLSVLSAASTASRLLPPRERLREVAFEYCQRLLEQSNRRALRKGDSDLQKACLVEAVLVLDVLCRQDPSFLYRTLSCLKPLHRRLGEDPGSERALVPLAQFFLNHGESGCMGNRPQRPGSSTLRGYHIDVFVLFYLLVVLGMEPRSFSY
eukprot:XP_008767255.1 PREDICTED: AP-5 complex subunit zeta-1-like [Rattus norvegicus]